MRRKSGFTLIELIVVASVLGILLNAASYNSSKVLKKSKDAALKLQISAVRSAIHQFILDNNGRFPCELKDLSPSYLNKAPTAWQSGRCGGCLHYNPETGALALYDADNNGPSTETDASGVCYGSY